MMILTVRWTTLPITLRDIEEKELPIDPINAYNHMAIYLRWCMEHDLMGEDFLKEYGEVVKQVKADPASGGSAGVYSGRTERADYGSDVQ